MYRVGKSSLLLRFVQGAFDESYSPTIGNTLHKSITVRGQQYALELMDTAGQDEHDVLSSNFALRVHGYVLVYSITSESSFEMVKTIYDKILDKTGTNWVPAVLVGNKCDLQGQRCVSRSCRTNKHGLNIV